MTTTDSAAQRSEYIAQLDAALGPLPHALAVELRTEITEELAELDGSSLTERIAELGAPADIAAAALTAAAFTAESPERIVTPSHTQAAAAAAPRSVTASRGYAITAAIALGIGGLMFPGVGWLVGAVVVTTSSSWHVRERVWAIAIAPLTIALLWLVGAVIRVVQPQDAANPLLPAAYDGLWSTVLLTALIVCPLAMLWLLLKLRGRH